MHHSSFVKEKGKHAFALIPLGECLERSVLVCSFREPFRAAVLGRNFEDTYPALIARDDGFQQVGFTFEQLQIALACPFAHIFLGLGQFLRDKFWTQFTQFHVLL